MTEIVRESAPAKINPYLRVLGKRPDGYHEIETLILPISLVDQVAVKLSDERIGLRVTGPLAERVPKGDDNLAIRAARALADASGERRGVNILIEKRVPVAAGLGGGSSDAAAVLRALNRLWRLELTLEQLAEIGATVSSDVPALVHACPVIARGRGELIEPVDIPTTHWVLVIPPFEVSSGDAYADARRSRRLLRRSSVGALVDALGRGDLAAAGSALVNDLSPGVVKRHPDLRGMHSTLAAGRPPYRAVSYSTGSNPPRPVGVVMSGSGPTIAGLCPDEQTARRVARLLRGEAVSTAPWEGSARLG